MRKGSGGRVINIKVASLHPHSLGSRKRGEEREEKKKVQKSHITYGISLENPHSVMHKEAGG